MTSNRRIAIAVGVLFIIATAAGAGQFPFLTSLNGPDYLVDMSSHGNKIMTAVLLDLIMIGCVLAIPVVIYPVLRRHSELMARGYVVARTFEGIALTIGVFSMIGLLTLSRNYAIGGVNAPHYETLGILLRATSDWALLIGGQVILSLTALIVNVAMVRFRLVPRFLSLWGLIAVPLMLASGLVVMFGLADFSSTLTTVLIVPLAVQEMAFALWLIVRGFNPTTASS